VADDLNPCLRIWRYEQAPAELRQSYREACGETGEEELLIHVSREMCAGDGSLGLKLPALWFLDWFPKRAGQEKYAGEEWGCYYLHPLPDGGRLVVTKGGWEAVSNLG